MRVDERRGSPAPHPILHTLLQPHLHCPLSHLPPLWPEVGPTNLFQLHGLCTCCPYHPAPSCRANSFLSHPAHVLPLTIIYTWSSAFPTSTLEAGLGESLHLEQYMHGCLTRGMPVPPRSLPQGRMTPASPRGPPPTRKPFIAEPQSLQQKVGLMTSPYFSQGC